MLQILFPVFIVFFITLAGCEKKEIGQPDVETPRENAVVSDAEDSSSSADQSAQNAELTKVSSQGAAAEQAKGVFERASAGDPEAVFLARCQYCHVALGPGTITLSRRLGPEEALLANRTDLTEDYIKAVARNGLNTMPALTRVEVSDSELELITDYLTRNNRQ